MKFIDASKIVEKIRNNHYISQSEMDYIYEVGEWFGNFGGERGQDDRNNSTYNFIETMKALLSEGRNQ